MRTVIQALAHVTAEQAGLAVVPGQGQYIEGVEVIPAQSSVITRSSPRALPATVLISSGR